MTQQDKPAFNHALEGYETGTSWEMNQNRKHDAGYDIPADTHQNTIIRHEFGMTEFTCWFDGITYSGEDQISRVARIIIQDVEFFMCYSCQERFGIIDSSGKVQGTSE